jgi:hypothetical protein
LNCVIYRKRLDIPPAEISSPCSIGKDSISYLDFLGNDS